MLKESFQNNSEGSAIKFPNFSAYCLLVIFTNFFSSEYIAYCVNFDIKRLMDTSGA